MSQHPNKLLELIQSRITQQGPMDIGQYMGLCLGHPQYGYYMTRDPFGANGDFITASANVTQLDPELKPEEIATEYRAGVDLDSVLSNSFGCGGTKATLVMSKFRG